VGLLTGATVLAGTGAGAAAGLTVILVMRGKNVDIDAGERFNLELIQPVSIIGGYGDYGPYTRGRQIRRPVQLQPPRQRSFTSESRQRAGIDPYDDPYSVRTQWSRVPVYDASAQRDRDGMLRVTVTSETSTAGWRIYTNHELPSRDTLDIRLLGIPPSQYGVRRTDHPSAPAICIDDRDSAIRRIIIHGSNGARYLSIGQGATSARIDSNLQPTSSNSRAYYPPTTSQTRPRLAPRRSGGTGDQYDNYLLPQSSTDNLSLLAAKTANQVEIVKAFYAPQIGLWMDGQGSQLPGTRRATTTERQLYDTLVSIQTSAKSLASASSSSSRLRAGQQIQRDTQSAQQLFQRVKSSSSAITPEIDRRWQEAYNNLRALSAAATR
jgi:hypothetical protein